MKKNNFSLKKISRFLFLLSLFFIRLPPFYIFYPIKNSMTTSHSLSGYIMVILLVYIIIESFIKKKLIIEAKKKDLTTIFIIYFLFQSLSIIGAMNTSSFLQSYKNIVFAGIFFFVTLHFKDLIKEIVVVIIITTIGNFFYQTTMLLFPNFFKTIASLFIYNAHLDLVNVNLERGRIYSQTYDELTIPFIIFFLQKEEKPKNRFLYLLMLLVITAMSLVSNFRTNVIMFIFALLASFFVFFRKKIKSIVKIVILITIIAIMLDKMMNGLFGFSFYNRLLLENQTEDVQTIRSREEHIIRSSKMGFSRPFFGVGLGNYYEYLPIQTKTSSSLFRWKSKEAEMAATDPHNILAQVLAETGIISLFFYIFMLINFIIGDSKKIFSKDKNQVVFYNRAVIVAFWTLFVYSFFNPSTTLTHNVLFWLLRVLI